MKTALRNTSIFLLILSLACALSGLAESPVPDRLPQDLGGKTLYGYLTDLKKNYMPPKIFVDAVKYSDTDRENARRAARLIAEITSEKMEEAGKPDQYNLYLRAYANDLLFQDSKDISLKEKALGDYLKTVELGGAYAQADYDRLAVLVVQAAPISWQVPQMLTPEEVGEILHVGGGDILLVKSTYQNEEGSRLGLGYTVRSLSDPAGSTVYVLADPQGGKERYERVKGFAFLRKTEDIPGLGDEAVAIGLRNLDNNPNLYTTVLVLKDNLVLQVRVPSDVWSGPGFYMNPLSIAKSLAEKFLDNVYDASRAISEAGSYQAEDIVPRIALNPGTPDSSVPDELPGDLGGKTIYGYLVSLRQAQLPADVFSSSKFGAQERNNARRALRLIADTISKGFDLNGQNPYELEIRGACYAAAYADTGEPLFQRLAINDYKQGLSFGYPLVKADYDRLAAPLLAEMAELREGERGSLVVRLQEWLESAGFFEGTATGVFDGVTVETVKAFEAEAGLTADGIADIACVLALYAEVIGGDALFYSQSGE